MLRLFCAGEETLKKFIAKRKEALHLCDEVALQKYAASAQNIRQQSQSEGEPLGKELSYLQTPMLLLLQSAISKNVLVLFDLLYLGLCSLSHI